MVRARVICLHRIVSVETYFCVLYLQMEQIRQHVLNSPASSFILKRTKAFSLKLTLFSPLIEPNKSSGSFFFKHPFINRLTTFSIGSQCQYFLDK